MASSYGGAELVAGWGWDKAPGSRCTPSAPGSFVSNKGRCLQVPGSQFPIPIAARSPGPGCCERGPWRPCLTWLLCPLRPQPPLIRGRLYTDLCDLLARFCRDAWGIFTTKRERCNQRKRFSVLVQCFVYRVPFTHVDLNSGVLLFVTC